MTRRLLLAAAPRDSSVSVARSDADGPSDADAREARSSSRRRARVPAGHRHGARGALRRRDAREGPRIPRRADRGPQVDLAGGARRGAEGLSRGPGRAREGRRGPGPVGARGRAGAAHHDRDRRSGRGLARLHVRRPHVAAAGGGESAGSAGGPAVAVREAGPRRDEVGDEGPEEQARFFGGGPTASGIASSTTTRWITISSSRSWTRAASRGATR